MIERIGGDGDCQGRWPLGKRRPFRLGVLRGVYLFYKAVSGEGARRRLRAAAEERWGEGSKSWASEIEQAADGASGPY